MIGVASRADGDIVRKTEVLRASADELALRTEDQGKDIAKLRNAIELLKSDHSAHITGTVSRMNEIDAEMKAISDEKIQYDRKTAQALKDIESIRRELVQLGAKLAKEFIMLPLPVPRYPRLDRSAEKESLLLLSQNKEIERGTAGGTGRGNGVNSTIWYTDDQPAANLQCVDLCISSAIAALDGRISDEDFLGEIEASRSDPDSIFSKESLIKSVAAASPMKRRRASLLMLSQASKELAKQSATFDDLTRGPMRWTEVERIQAERFAQMHDAMIRDAVKEMCKVAPVPRQAERQLLTALDLHPMPTYRSTLDSSDNISSSSSHGPSRPLTPVDGNSGSAATAAAAAAAASNLYASLRSEGGTARISQPPQLRPATRTLLTRKTNINNNNSTNATNNNKFSIQNYMMMTNVSMDMIAENVEKFADIQSGSARYHGSDARKREQENSNIFSASMLSSNAKRSGAKDPLLRQLQAELQEEQSAIGLRSHAARVQAWQELDLKRSARNRFNPNDISNLNNVSCILEKKYNDSSNNNNNNSNSSSHHLSQTELQHRRPVSSSLSSISSSNRYIEAHDQQLEAKSPAAVFSVICSAATLLPSTSDSPRQENTNRRIIATARSSPPFTVMRQTNIPLVQQQQQQESLLTRTTPTAGRKILLTTMTSDGEEEYEYREEEKQHDNLPESVDHSSSSSSSGPYISRKSAFASSTPPVLIPPRYSTPTRIHSTATPNSTRKIHPACPSSSSAAVATAETLGLASEQIELSPLTVHRSTGLIVRDRDKLHQAQQLQVGHVVRKDKNQQAASSVITCCFNASTNVDEQTNEPEEQRRSPSPSLALEQQQQHRPLALGRPPSASSAAARAGIPDPESATQAVMMRRTGALEAASLSFHNPRLDEAAKRLGIIRPPSATQSTAQQGRFHWKLKNRPHELEEEARAIQQSKEHQNVQKQQTTAGVD